MLFYMNLSDIPGLLHIKRWNNGTDRKTVFRNGGVKMVLIWLLLPFAIVACATGMKWK